MSSLISELRRRHVFRVAAAYAVVAWLLIQIAATTFPAFGAPAWVLRVVIALAVLGFPVALVIAWAFELTPDGIRPAEPLPTAEPARPRRAVPRGRVAGWVGVGILVGLISVGAYGWIRMPETAPGFTTGSVRSVAVLPFIGLGGGADSEYLAEGISEELLDALSRVPQLQVAARTSSFSFQGQAVGLDSIARALKVEHVLGGSVRSENDRVRISAQLIDAATGRQVWSQSYNRELPGLLAVQQEIAMAIANALQVKLAGGDSAQLMRSRTADPEAYELYLQGRRLSNERTSESLRGAIQRFEAALERDPAFAAAYSGLADSYTLLDDYKGMPREEAFPKAIAAATRALQLDELQAEAHASLGHIYFHQRNWAASDREYQRALELNPNYATAHHWYANLLLATNRLPEATRTIRRASELDPLSPTIREVRGYILYNARDYGAAIGWMEEQLKADPQNTAVLYILAWFKSAAGQHTEAIAIMQRVLELLPERERDGWARTRLAAAYAAAGRREEAIPILEELERSPPGEANETVMAVAYGHLGDSDRAFQWLDRAVEREHWMIAYLEFEPAFDPLRQDSRFAEVLRRVERTGL